MKTMKKEEALKVLQEEQDKKIKQYIKELQVFSDKLNKDGLMLDVAVVVTQRGNIPQLDIRPK